MTRAQVQPGMKVTGNGGGGGGAPGVEMAEGDAAVRAAGGNNIGDNAAASARSWVERSMLGVSPSGYGLGRCLAMEVVVVRLLHQAVKWAVRCVGSHPVPYSRLLYYPTTDPHQSNGGCSMYPPSPEAGGAAVAAGQNGGTPTLVRPPSQNGGGNGSMMPGSGIAGAGGSGGGPRSPATIRAGTTNPSPPMTHVVQRPG